MVSEGISRDKTGAGSLTSLHHVNCYLDVTVPLEVRLTYANLLSLQSSQRFLECKGAAMAGPGV